MASPALTWWSATQFQSVPVETDETLVASAKLGDETAFAQLIQRHYRFCVAKAYTYLRSHEDAEDESQNAFAKAWQCLHQFQGDGSFGGWLNRIVSNECLMRIRERNGARTISVDEVFESEGSFRLEVIDQRALPEDSAGDEEAARMLQVEIGRLPTRLRETLILRDLRQCSMQEIAARVGISVPAAKSRLLRARRELRARLTNQFGDQGCYALARRSSRPRAAFVRATVN